ncbi:M56 family metallopeptidase [Chryseobacterium tongliaoense]|uniref:M56 family metallopeptidase n=1 Tax=Chryseobacterium tongliaoense TaxID=3240933 RepID=UPI0035143063
MVFILLKIVLCSSLLITLYYLFLEKEKMYRFNRLFLIFSLIFSYVVPFISVTMELPEPKTQSKLIFEETAQQITIFSPQQESFSRMDLVWMIYGAVTLFFLIKAIISVVRIKKLNGKRVNYLNYKTIITEDSLSPFSFWNTIYIGKNYFKNNEIDSRIFLHEKSHLDQKHSLDLLFIEILKIFTWFNPAIYFYKKAMVTNHEFLADESVLKINSNIKDYQRLILQEVISNQNYNLSHTFNFNNTKKRFIMMNTKKSNLTGIKKAVSIPVLVIVFGLFVQKTYASNPGLSLNDSEKSLNELKESISALKVIPTNGNQIVSDTIPAKKNKKASTKTEIKNKNKEKSPPPPPPSSGTRKVNTKSDTNVPPPPPPSVSRTADLKPAEYPGGVNQLRSNVASNFDSSVFTGKEKGMLKSEALISIDKNGKVTDIKTTGSSEKFNAETYRVLKQATDNVVWAPAQKDGEPVAYQYRLPLAMSFK